ncbi:MAG TPA: hypothetical protein VFF06_13520 [Polyangia bacterium]|nr:hypothetical protein [Polyangia bacterium]
MRTSVWLLLFAAACSSSPARTGNHDGGSNPGHDGGGPFMPGPPETHDIVDPSLPMGVVGGFDSATPQAGALSVVYPQSGVILPHDLAPIDVQWNAVGGATVYRVTYAVTTGDRLRGYVPKADWIPTATDWQWLMDRASGHTVTLTVDGGTADASGKISNAVGSAPQPLSVSHDDATGALFYFATTGDQISGDGTLERLEVGAQAPDKYLNKSNDGGRCVGCHTLTRDGTRLAFDFLDFGGVGGALSLGSVDASNPTMQQAAASTPVAQATFNPDGSKLLTSYQGKLTLRDGTTGAQISTVTTSSAALYPDWSPDGAHVVFVRPSSLCSPGVLPFGQDSIFVYGGSLVTMDVSNGTFSNEQVLLAPTSGENFYYPSYSPDGKYIAFSRADGTTKSSWSVANMACNGKDGSGLSYDNPSAEVWLVSSTGGQGFPLTAANGGPMRTNSWPKWGPKSDGEYLWLSFTSTRPYGNVLAGANAHHQIWIAAVQPATMDIGGADPSAPAVWFPFQDTTTKNHIGMWSVKVGDYTIP